MFKGMVRWSAWIPLVLLASSHWPAALARNANQDTVIAHPEALAGIWETPDGHGGAVGMSVQVTTKVVGRPPVLATASQYRQAIEVGLFHRTGPNVEEMGFNFFSDSERGGMTWDGHRMRVDLAAAHGNPAYRLDLIWNEADASWTGRYERGDYRGQVVLRRPHADKKMKASPFAGTWLSPSKGYKRCLHIVEQPGGTLSAWDDQIQVPAELRYAPGLVPPQETFESYGSPVKSHLTPDGRLGVEFGGYAGICCANGFVAKVAGDGRTLEVDWEAGPNMFPHSERWKRVEGDSCIRD